MILYWAIFVERRLFLSLLAVPIILYFYDGEIASRLWSIFQGHDTSADLRWALWDSTNVYRTEKILSLVLGGIHFI